jgi:hypothetical protein
MKVVLQLAAVIGILVISSAAVYYFVVQLPQYNKQKLSQQQQLDQQDIKTQRFDNCEKQFKDSSIPATSNPTYSWDHPQSPCSPD